MALKGKTGTVLLALLIGLIILPAFVPAVNMSFSDLNLITSQDILIYNSNGTMIGQYNTSSPDIPIPESDLSS
jgi:hypothetical protein